MRATVMCRWSICGSGAVIAGTVVSMLWRCRRNACWGRADGRIEGMSEIPSHIGPCEFGMLGRQVAVRCPRQFDALMRNAGGQWEAGSRRWLIERRRIGPVIRALERGTDPLFRRAGLNLDHG